jgi:FtsP/CotA-like multicopper oxidase with cupredoxin domain
MDSIRLVWTSWWCRIFEVHLRPSWRPSGQVRAAFVLAGFQVLSRTGGRGRLFPWEAGWKDTVLEDRETVEVLIQFGAYRGEYLLHCHKLEHEDMGMMANFVVV